MSASADYPVRRLESGDAAEVSGNADGAAAVAREAARRAPRGDGGGFPAARSTRSASRVPRVQGGSGYKVVGLVARQQFRHVGLSKNDGSGRAQAGDGVGIAVRDVTEPEPAAAQCREAADIEAILDGDGNTVQGE